MPFVVEYFPQKIADAELVIDHQYICHDLVRPLGMLTSSG
jgi:hypothetical protein